MEFKGLLNLYVNFSRTFSNRIFEKEMNIDNIWWVLCFNNIISKYFSHNENITQIWDIIDD